ncbi:hypothetical protein BDW69DRAFT_205523 [Aspergillus filifer]
MVGVPGRSKACVTCLKRKKRCDLEKPFCGTCRRARVECGGYHRARIFINNTIDNQNMQVVKKEQTMSRHTRESSSSSDSSSEFRSQLEIALPPTLARSAYQARYLDLFWRMYLPNGEALSVEVKQIALGKWVDAIYDLQNSDPVLKKALVAMSVSAVGKQDNNRVLKEEGRRLYMNSLQALSVALQDPKRASCDAILTAIKLCSFNESMFGQNDGEIRQIRNWQAHNAGEIALVSMRSPWSFISGYAHDLFADGRSTLAMSYMRMRKRCFLADEEWRTIPWLEQPKNPRDHLMDILLDLTGMFEEIDTMKATTDIFEKEFSRQNLLDGLCQLQQGLLTWQLLHAPHDFEPVTKKQENVAPHDLACAHIMTTFWATVIIVVSNLQAICLPGEDLANIFDLDLCCANIARTFPLFIHPAMGLFRTHITTYPMTVAMHYVCAAGAQRLTEERRILADCLYDPALSGVRQFIGNMKDEFPMEFLK